MGTTTDNGPATTAKGGTLYLIDGYAQFFRAFHAIRTDMRSPVTSEPTNMTYGFVDMLLKLQNVHQPQRLAVVLDVSGDRGTFRSEIYPEYKANRDAPPSELKPQVERCLSLLEQLGIRVLQFDIASKKLHAVADVVGAVTEHECGMIDRGIAAVTEPSGFHVIHQRLGHVHQETDGSCQ